MVALNNISGERHGFLKLRNRVELLLGLFRKDGIPRYLIRVGCDAVEVLIVVERDLFLSRFELLIISVELLFEEDFCHLGSAEVLNATMVL